MTSFVLDAERKQIEELHAALTGPKAAAAVDICAIWNVAEPYWPAIVAAATRIPKYGKALGAILGALGKALDACCPEAAKAAEAVETSGAEATAIEESYAAIFGAAGAKPCCDLWNKLKPKWNDIITWVRRIPVIGDRLADILQRIGEALDRFCG